MAFVEMVETDAAEGRVAEVYETARNPSGFVPDATRLFSGRPELMAGLEGFKRQVVWGGSTLPRRLEDLIAVTVGRLNRNAYVSLSHAEALRASGSASADEILTMTADYSAEGLSELERAVLRLAEKLTQRSDGSTAADAELLRRQGLDDQAILDVVVAIGFWNFQTRVFSALGLEPEPWKLERADAALADGLAFQVSAAGTPDRALDARAGGEEAPELGAVGTTLLYENELVNVWEVALRPGEVQPWHTHRHPYLVISLEDGASRITQFASGSARDVDERRGQVVFRAAGDVHNLENIGDAPTVTRLIELKTAPEGSWAPAYISPYDPFRDYPQPAATPSPATRGERPSREVLIHALADDGFEQVNKVPGERSKLLWSRAGERGLPIRDDASIHMVRFAKGAGIPSVHAHASNQFMFCLSGRYLYKSSGLVVEPGDFYYNPSGSKHGPTEALEDTVLLEIYDGPHYVVTPEFEYQHGEERQ